jgi:hypothetical protein
VIFLAKKYVEDFRKLKNLALGGSLAAGAASLIPHARHPDVLIGSVPGFVGIGVAGKASDVAFDMIGGRRKKRKKRKRK